MEDMRLALAEQEETQSQMEEVLEEKLHLIQELSSGETQDLKKQTQTLWKDCWFHCFELKSGLAEVQLSLILLSSKEMFMKDSK